ncbi:hypothetical protein INT47_006956 [Mucor saturninus]|uniref:BZIP domain-containing protein n=1 Tax=Mucor saturninus TaxID=64648 RepID=A0A8H7QQM8_9FUNG|nr:hypothetical protein INT47_006956 [Mucor saturninus]
MNNNDNTHSDPILDWILQPDTNEDTSKPISTELLSFLMTQNGNLDLTQQQSQQQQQQQQQVSPETTAASHLTSSPSEEDEEPTHEQLKMMPSKERRQLRNKISARNFRNRRKEYMNTLEAEMGQCKAENSQLKLEVKWVREMMEKLQAENDKLRLQLVLCKEGIQPPRKATENNVTVSPETPSNSLSLFNSSDDNWNILYPPVVTNTNTNNVYLAHASLPDWDMSNIYEKKDLCLPIPTEKSDLIRTYPLLAPALMSIVLNHTMTMTTEEIIANSTLYDPTWATPSSTKEKCELFDPIAWQKVLDSLQKPAVVPSESTNVPKEQTSQVSYFVENYCPLYWIQKQFCNFVISYVVVRYPRLDTKCRTYLPICERYRKKRITQLV